MIINPDRSEETIQTVKAAFTALFAQEATAQGGQA